jgi:hypothetical protein
MEPNLSVVVVLLVVVVVGLVVVVEVVLDREVLKMLEQQNIKFCYIQYYKTIALPVINFLIKN